MHHYNLEKLQESRILTLEQELERYKAAESAPIEVPTLVKSKTRTFIKK